MKTKLILLLGILLIIPLISAEMQTLGTFQINKNLELKQIAVNFTHCNITSVSYPNSTRFIQDVAMSKRGNEYNFTILASNITETGEYIVNGFCCYADGCVGFTYDFYVSQGGKELSTGQGLLYIVFLVCILFVFSLCLYGAIRLPFKQKRNNDGKIMAVNNLRYLKIFLFVMSYILLLFILGITKSILSNFLSLDNASEIFNYLYWIMLSCMYPLIVLSLIFVVVSFLQNLKLNKMLRRNLFTR